MMLALVKCLFWIIKRATETELVLAHLSFFTFHLSVSVTFAQLYEAGDTTNLCWQYRKETLIATSNNVKQIISKNVLRCVLSTKRCYVIKDVILGSF